MSESGAGIATTHHSSSGRRACGLDIGQHSGNATDTTLAPKGLEEVLMGYVDFGEGLSVVD